MGQIVVSQFVTVDGVIEDPAKCTFDFAALTCRGEDRPDCLTKDQVETANAMTRPIRDPKSGAVLQQLLMPDGTFVSGLESDGKDRFYCGGGQSGKVRAIKRPKRA